MRQSRLLYYIVALMVFSSCSTTSSLKDGEQLFTGLKPIDYQNYEESSYADSAMLEMESVLASAPNGALFGSSYYRTPFPVRLWIWNAFSQGKNPFSKWVTKAFGSQPKLMSNVNPQLRAQVAENQLIKYGYFGGKVTYDIVQQGNPKKAKVQYHVDFGHLWTLDTVKYQSFPVDNMRLIDSTHSEALVRSGSPFNVSQLEAERQRIGSLFRNNGYYFYQSSFASYLADTVSVPGKAEVRLVMADSVDVRASKKWYIGNININFRKQFMEQLTDTLQRAFFTARYSGEKMPIRPGFVLRDLSLRPRRLYRQEDEERARRNIQSTGLYSYSQLSFTPRDTTALCDTLDVTLDLVFDKPYDFYIEANAKGKTTGRVGPELVVGLAKRNALRGGERLEVNLHGSHEWQTKATSSGQSRINSYEFGADAALVFPRIITPRSIFQTLSHNERRLRQGRMRLRRYYGTPTTTVKASMNILSRASYFRRHVASGELSYSWKTSAQSTHTWSPLTLSYEFMNSKTAAFDSVLNENPYLQISMRDQFVPKMSYTYAYTSPSRFRHPISWTTTVSEAANILSLAYMAFGEDWNQKDKTMFKNPFAQFLKIETDFAKYWRMGNASALVFHLNAGVIWSYGNAERAPYYEQFYIGGANSIRAFNVRSIGPGKYQPTGSRFSYIDQTGDIKMLANVEYRPRLWGDLYGALFLDAGNVWNFHNAVGEGGRFKLDEFYKQMAVGTGVGLRYDMGMFVIRVDWGIGLHIPYDTGKGGFYNIRKFSDAQSLHLAVGYPF